MSFFFIHVKMSHEEFESIMERLKGGHSCVFITLNLVCSEASIITGLVSCDIV